MGLQALLASIGGVLSILAILTYPVGLFKLWLQLDRDYTHDLRTAWYAASLISPTEVAGQAVMLLSLSCLAVGISLALAVATLSLMGRGRYGFFSPEVQDRNSKKVTIYTGEAKGLPPQLFEFRFLSARPRLIKSLVGGSVLLLVLGLVIYGFAVANTSSQLFFYLAFCLLSAIGGAVSAFLMIKMPYAKVSISKEGDVRSNREARRQAREVINPELMRRLVRDFRRWLVLGLGCALIAAVSATLCLSEVTDLTLPVAVVESEGQSESISLLTHSAGYWHGFNCRSDMVAIPDKEAKEVQIIAEADLLRSRCQVK